MDFLLWAARAMHLFSAIIWLGGALYQAVILLPGVARGEPERPLLLNQARAFLPFMWTGLLTVLVTGTGLMLFSPRFVFFSYPDWWSVGLGLKQAAFVLMTIFSFGYSRMVVGALGTGSEGRDAVQRMTDRMIEFNRYVILFGLGALLIAASMNRG